MKGKGTDDRGKILTLQGTLNHVLKGKTKTGPGRIFFVQFKREGITTYGLVKAHLLEHLSDLTSASGKIKHRRAVEAVLILQYKSLYFNKMRIFVCLRMVLVISLCTMGFILLSDG